MEKPKKKMCLLPSEDELKRILCDECNSCENNFHKKLNNCFDINRYAKAIHNRIKGGE